MLLLVGKPPLNDDTVSPGLLGFAVFLALCVAVFFLLRSMSKRISRIQAPKEADLKQQEWESKAGAQEAAEGAAPEPAQGTTQETAKDTGSKE